MAKPSTNSAGFVGAVLPPQLSMVKFIFIFNLILSQRLSFKELWSTGIILSTSMAPREATRGILPSAAASRRSKHDALVKAFKLGQGSVSCISPSLIPGATTWWASPAWRFTPRQRRAHRAKCQCGCGGRAAMSDNN